MSDPGLSINEEPLSPDMFSEVDMSLTTNTTIMSDDSNSASIGVSEPEPTDDIPEWKGMSLDEIHRGLGVYDYHEMPPICPSSHHTILISLPLPAYGPPKPYPSHQVDKWSQGYVRMPHSKHSMYPIEQGRDNDGNRQCRNRWEIIQESLLQTFVSTHQLEAAIFSYNHKYAQRWDFEALHHFFSETVDEEETRLFFEVLMPKMVQLALQLPVLVTGAVPLLKSHTNGTITLSQLQIASLVANAFFCTFPRRNSTNPQSEYGTYPFINFNRLFSAMKKAKPSRCDSLLEKLKCIFHYFRRVTTKAPEGVVTIQRRYIPKQDCPKWDQQNKKLLPLHITSRGTIETEGAGLLQVDFANKYIGGGVLGLGCVQEEIRFAICPELIVTMLVAERLDDTEALIVTGVERYSKYEGYSNSFKWMGDYIDETPKDSSGRRLTSIVAIDALSFNQPAAQFSISKITRELNKAYVGFVRCEGSKNNLPAIATGNWGCGAFRGNPKLKVLLQLMAASVTGRSMVYFTFGDKSLRDDIAAMYSHLVQHDTDIAHLYSLLVQYQELAATGNLDFYRFLYNPTKIKPISKYFLPKNNKVQKQVCTMKETMMKRSQSLIIDEKHNTRIDFKRKETEEERIETWLANIDDDLLTEETPEQPKEMPKELKNKTITINDQGDDSAERKNQLLRKLFQDKAQSKTTCERRLRGLALFDAERELISNELDNNLLTASKQQTEVVPREMNIPETVESSSGLPIQSCKRHSSVKKGAQKKISDFFQRTS